MTDKIEPALTPEQWASIEADDGTRVSDYFMGEVALSYAHTRDEHGRGVTVGTKDSAVGLFFPDSVRALIVLANAALPESDPRKITREMVAFLRSLGEWIAAAPESQKGAMDEWRIHNLTRFVAALESYLPPEKP